MARELIRTPAFARASRRYLKKHPQADAELEKTLTLLAADVFDPRLKSHKLTGEFDGVWACSAGYDLRILFEFVEDDSGPSILLLAIGTHDDVY